MRVPSLRLLVSLHDASYLLMPKSLDYSPLQVPQCSEGASRAQSEATDTPTTRNWTPGAAKAATIEISQSPQPELPAAACVPAVLITCGRGQCCSRSWFSQRSARPRPSSRPSATPYEDLQRATNRVAERAGLIEDVDFFEALGGDSRRVPLPRFHPPELRRLSGPGPGGL